LYMATAEVTRSAGYSCICPVSLTESCSASPPCVIVSAPVKSRGCASGFGTRNVAATRRRCVLWMISPWSRSLLQGTLRSAKSAGSCSTGGCAEPRDQLLSCGWLCFFLRGIMRPQFRPGILLVSASG